ncbi:MAG: PTS sugar transporter subunit IIBC [Clostridia bacterium]
MTKNIVAVCDNEICKKELEKACKYLGFIIKAEVQKDFKIKNEISIEEIKSSNVVLFAIDGTVEDIEKIERFIECEYYEVEPKFIIKDAKAIIDEIVSDIN